MKPRPGRAGPGRADSSASWAGIFNLTRPFSVLLTLEHLEDNGEPEGQDRGLLGLTARF